MRVFVDVNALQAAPEVGQASVLTIGNFDGCHVGHRKLIQAAADLAAAQGATRSLCTFDPNPHLFFRPDASFRPLFTLPQKLAAFRDLGIDAVLVQSFDAAFSRIDHPTFFATYIRQGFRATGVVVGDDFRFGVGRQGDVAYLRRAGEAAGIAVSPMAPVRVDDEVVSSSRIRRLLATDGAVAEAARLLGRPYGLEGRIVSGDKLGRTIGVPTANLDVAPQLVPQAGIYAGHVALAPAPGFADSLLHVPADAVPAVFSIGVRPTVAEGLGLCIEAHLLAGEYGAESLYGMHARYFLRHRLREERRYPDLVSLKAQIAADITEAKARLAADH